MSEQTEYVVSAKDAARIAATYESGDMLGKRAAYIGFLFADAAERKATLTREAVADAVAFARAREAMPDASDADVIESASAYRVSVATVTQARNAYETVAALGVKTALRDFRMLGEVATALAAGATARDLLATARQTHDNIVLASRVEVLRERVSEAKSAAARAKSDAARAKREAARKAKSDAKSNPVQRDAEAESVARQVIADAESATPESVATAPDPTPADIAKAYARDAVAAMGALHALWESLAPDVQEHVSAALSVALAPLTRESEATPAKPRPTARPRATRAKRETVAA